MYDRNLVHGCGVRRAEGVGKLKVWFESTSCLQHMIDFLNSAEKPKQLSFSQRSPVAVASVLATFISSVATLCFFLLRISCGSDMLQRYNKARRRSCRPSTEGQEISGEGGQSTNNGAMINSAAFLSRMLCDCVCHRSRLFTLLFRPPRLKRTEPDGCPRTPTPPPSLRPPAYGVKVCR